MSIPDIIADMRKMEEILEAISDLDMMELETVTDIYLQYEMCCDDTED